MKTKTQISFAVTAKLISAFVFAIQIVQPLCYLNPKFRAFSYLLWLYSPVCVGPGRKPRRPVFSQRGSNRLSSKWANVNTNLSPCLTLRPICQGCHALGQTIYGTGWVVAPTPQATQQTFFCLITDKREPRVT